MALLDQILGGLIGSGQSSARSQATGIASSPLAKSLLVLLAAKAYQHYTAQPQGTEDPSRSGGVGGSPDPRLTNPAVGPGGGAGELGGLLSGGLGSLVGGLVSGGGLNAIVEQLRQNGEGSAVDSWIARGPNQPIAPDRLAEALGSNTIDDLAQYTGMRRDEVVSELSEHLPEAVDHVTPDGRLPTEQDVSRWV
jgi:uncharacterized protein YidB (DUF937 family)